MADLWAEADEVARVIPHERASERVRVQKQAVERMVGEQSGVIAVTETASQDRKLQHTVEQALLDLAEAVKIVPQTRILKRMGERFGVIEVTMNSSQENVKNKQMSGRTREQIGTIEAPESASQRLAFAAHRGAGFCGPCRGCQNCNSGANFCKDVSTVRRHRGVQQLQPGKMSR